LGVVEHYYRNIGGETSDCFIASPSEGATAHQANFLPQLYEQRGDIEGEIKGIFLGVDNCSSPEVQVQCTEEGGRALLPRV
jgi:hypothetical protein